MGFVDVISAEDRVDVKFSDFYKLMRESAKAELLMNAVDCDVPHRFIRETMTGKKEIICEEGEYECKDNQELAACSRV